MGNPCDVRRVEYSDNQFIIFTNPLNQKKKDKLERDSRDTLHLKGEGKGEEKISGYKDSQVVPACSVAISFNIWNFRLYLKENTTQIHYKELLVNAVYGNKCYLF